MEALALWEGEELVGSELNHGFTELRWQQQCATDESAEAGYYPGINFSPQCGKGRLDRAGAIACRWEQL
ncbi:hypothetical protein ABIF68_002626 [Bradyrhizobium japonicum]|jgi:hypothetical protein